MKPSTQPPGETYAILSNCESDIPMGLGEYMQRVCSTGIIVNHANGIVFLTFIEYKRSDQ